MVIKQERGTMADSNRHFYPMYKDHVYLKARKFGACGAMTGNIELIVVFVNDSKSVWSDAERKRFLNAVRYDAEYLEKQARKWGADLSIDYAYFEVNVPENQEERWYDYLMEDFFKHPEKRMETLQEYYEKKLGFDDTPLLFVFNCEGRSYCYEGDRDNNYREERPVYFAKSMGKDLSITHELLHLYGAYDYYYPELTKETAKRLFPDSSMLTGNREVDDLTAFLIGWTEYLTGKAIEFLEATQSLDSNSINKAINDIWDGENGQRR